MARDKDVFIVLNADGTGKWTRYDSDGRMVKGESYKNGAWYYFDTATGKMAHGKYYRDGAYYYYDTATGIMQYGEQTIDGDEYYFDTETGAMVTGEVERDGRYYYYDDETGAMLGLGEQIVKYAEKFLGTPYTWGGTSPDTGFDCSGFTQYVYSNFGIDLDRTSSAQRRQGEAVDEDDIMLGDLVCYSGHVAIYVGNGQVIHSPQEGEVVKISNMHMMSIITIRRFID